MKSSINEEYTKCSVPTKCAPVLLFQCASDWWLECNATLFFSLKNQQYNYMIPVFKISFLKM